MNAETPRPKKIAINGDCRIRVGTWGDFPGGVCGPLISVVLPEGNDAFGQTVDITIYMNNPEEFQTFADGVQEVVARLEAAGQLPQRPRT